MWNILSHVNYTIQLNVQLIANSFPGEYRILIVGCWRPSGKMCHAYPGREQVQQKYIIDKCYTGFP